MALKDMTLEDLGFAKKIVVTKDHTTILEGSGSKALIEERIEEIRKHIANASSDYDKKRLNERLGKLTDGVAMLKVGAVSEVELKDKKLRIEDALNATKAAVEEGIVIGGGACLVEVYKRLKNELKDEELDVQKGINIVLESLLKPIYQIAENAGYDGKEITELQMSAKENHGFNAKKGVWVDMLASGIIDPTKVTRSAVLNASSIAAMFITTEAAVVEIPEEKNDSEPMPPSMY